jgi:uncharacterized protein (TIGR02145 family)
MNKKTNNYISMDNINFSNSITSWTGGDLIYKSSNLSNTASNNKIKVGDKTCTTSGQGYTNNSAASDGIPQVGCILPDLQAGTHAVAISTDGGTSYKIKSNVVYAQTPTLSSCNTTSMQTFGANAAACKAAMQQGQVIVLNDTRNNQKYRVKKMPDGNVWMIDNLKYNGSSLPSGYCSDLVWTYSPGSLTGCGELNYWADAVNSSTNNWSIHPNSGTRSAAELNTKMLTAANDSNGNRNPVYSTVDYKNFSESGTGNPAPWLGVYAGDYINNKSSSGFVNQGSAGLYWSSDSVDGIYAYSLRIHLNNLVEPQNGGDGWKTNYQFSVRFVL